MVWCERWALASLAMSGAGFVPLALNRFVFAKLAVAAAGVLLASRAPARGRLPRGAATLLGGAALVLALTAIEGRTPLAQVFGRAPRYEGLFTLTVYLGACVAGARLLGARRARGSTAWFLRALAVAAIAIALEAVLEAAGLRPLSSNVARPGGLLGNASDLGAWAVLALGPLTAVALRTNEPRLVAGAIAAAATLVISGSRGALVGGLTVVLVLFVLTRRRVPRQALLAGLTLVAVGLLALPATRARVIATSPLAGKTIKGRELLWGETVRLTAAAPLLGVGPSGYLDAIPSFHTRRYELTVGPRTPPDSPHDWLLQAAAAGGLPLALLAGALAGLTLRCGYRATRTQPTGGEAAAVEGMLAGLAGYAVALLTHFTSPGTTPLAATLAGALLAGPAAASSDGWSRAQAVRAAIRPATARWAALARRRAASASLAVLVVILTAAAFAEIPLRAAIDRAAHADVTSAEDDLRLARALRPWDAAIGATAAHAYATLAAAGISPATAPGTRWSDRELTALPRSVQALRDAATLATALDTPAGAAGAEILLTRALRIDPTNPDLLIQAGAVAIALRRPAAAIGDLRSAAVFAPSSPEVWQALADAYREHGDRAGAALATLRAQRLSH